MTFKHLPAPARRMLAMAGALLTVGCSSPAPMPPVPHVDLDRFMGSWYVIGNIPSWPERHAYGAVETYTLRADGRIQVEFAYRDGGFDQPIKTLHPIGTVQPDTGNAVWGMQFIWPIQAEYVIAYLSPDYRTTIVARSKRDYVWIMARTPTIDDHEYAQLVARVAALGYDTAGLRRVPQQSRQYR